MYLEKILRKQEQERQRAERELLQLEKEQERWTKRWHVEKEKRMQLYENYYKKARDISYINGEYPVDTIMRLFIPVVTLGASIAIMYALAASFNIDLLGSGRLVIVFIALVIAAISYLVAPLIIEFFGIRRKIRTAAECKAGYELIEENEPLDD